jgi:hypothetical protein
MYTSHSSSHPLLPLFAFSHTMIEFLSRYVVLYDDEVCLGGGPITAVGPSYFEMKRDLPREVTE